MAERTAFLGPLIARLTLGVAFVGSGWGKIHNLDKVTEFFTELGIPAPHPQAVFVSWVELVCGALVLLGLATRLASIPLICTMIVALIPEFPELERELDKAGAHWTAGRGELAS